MNFFLNKRFDKLKRSNDFLSKPEFPYKVPYKNQFRQQIGSFQRKHFAMKLEPFRRQEEVPMSRRWCQAF